MSPGSPTHARRRRRCGSTLVTGLAAALLLVPAGGAAAAPRDRTADADRIPDRYIVVYRDSVDDVSAETDKREARQGFRAQNVYRRALKGFSAELSEPQVVRLEADPEVAFVSPDRKVRAKGAIAPGDSAPSGVRRIGAASASEAHSASGTNVAVIDTGIDLDHPDLNAAAGKNCVDSGPPEDGNGHGTHVAGSVAARNNGSGVVGVAPDTKVYAAKVLDAGGGGSLSSVICGVDWATATRTDSNPANDIGVANMSLGGLGQPVASCGTTTDALHKAICNSTAAGVDYVVAAGNSRWDFDFAPVPDVPAAYPQVLTVTAMADSDGKPGGIGGPPCDGQDDDTATLFSNFALTDEGKQHTIAAPGACINSTWLDGGYNTISGTSMASPHVAGAVALCLKEGSTSGPCAGLTSDQVVQKMRDDAKAKSDADPGYGFVGDPLRAIGGYYGYLAWVGLPVDKTKPKVTKVSPASNARGVSRVADVLATFSERMNPSTINKATVKLVRKGTSKAVPAGVSYSTSTRRAELDPKGLLAQGTTYTATVTTGAKDLAGNPLAGNKSWSFTTRR